MLKQSNVLFARRFSGLRSLRWYPAFLLLPLLLSATTPSDVAASARTTHFWIYTSPLPNSLCAGQTYSITVNVDSNTTNPFGPGSRAWNGIDVSASVDDPSIATITPPRQMTGSGAAPPQGNTPPNADEDELPALPVRPSATFQLHALKAGRTAFTFIAEVPPRIIRRPAATLRTTTAFEVINCDYFVTVTFGLHTFPRKEFWSETNGTLSRGKLKVDPDTHQITGSGVLYTFDSAGGVFPHGRCTMDSYTTENPVDITGSLENGLLKLVFDFHESTTQETWRCNGPTPIRPTEFGAYVDQHPGTLFGRRSPAPYYHLEDITIPEEGGITTKDIHNPNDRRTFVDYYIQVLPEPASTR